MVLLPLLARQPKFEGWVIMGAVELLALLFLLGVRDPERYWWCLRIVGAVVFLTYVAYLVDMTTTGQWIGDGRRSSATALNAFLGLIAFGYPGLMYALFGRFTWWAKLDQE